MRILSKIYDTYGQARQAVADLNAAGVPDSKISLVANKHVSAEYDDVDEHEGAATGAGIGAAVGGAGGLLAGLGIMAIPGIGPAASSEPSSMQAYPRTTRRSTPKRSDVVARW
jgi:hypothetical protein